MLPYQAPTDQSKHHHGLTHAKVPQHPTKTQLLDLLRSEESKRKKFLKQARQHGNEISCALILMI